MHQVLRYLHHVALLGISHGDMDERSILLRLKNPLNSDGTSLDFDDRVVIARMHCATIDE